MSDGVRMGRMGGVIVAALLLPWLLPGCGSDLGECDMAALATTTDGVHAYAGQRLIHQTCAAGQCHSSSAEGEARVGAPAELDFDLIPTDTSPLELAKVTRGEANVDELAEDMWAWIADGKMPPEGQRTPLAGANKETVRNWLACGAPVNNAPDAAATADWASIFATLQMSSCAACHSAGSMMGAWYGADACSTRANLLAGVATNTCAPTGARMIVPGMPDASLIVQKLEQPMPCGMVMPPERPPATPSPIAAPLRQWIAAGALAPECP